MSMFDAITRWNLNRQMASQDRDTRIQAIRKVSACFADGEDIGWAVKRLEAAVLSDNGIIRKAAMNLLLSYQLKVGNHDAVESLLKHERQEVRDAVASSFYQITRTPADMEPHIDTIVKLLEERKFSRQDRRANGYYVMPHAKAICWAACDYFYKTGKITELAALRTHPTTGNDVNNWVLNRAAKENDQNSERLLDFCIDMLADDRTKNAGSGVVKEYALSKGVFLADVKRLEKIAAAFCGDYVTCHNLASATYFLASDGKIDITPILPAVAAKAEMILAAGNNDPPLLDELCNIFVLAAKRGRDVSSGVGFMTALLAKHDIGSRYSRPAACFFSEAAKNERVDIEMALPGLNRLSVLPKHMAARWGSPNYSDLNEEVREAAKAALVNRRNRGKDGELQRIRIVPPAPSAGPKGTVRSG